MKIEEGDKITIQATVLFADHTHVNVEVEGRQLVVTYSKILSVIPRPIAVGDTVGMVKGCHDRPTGTVVALYERWALADFGFKPPIVVLISELERLPKVASRLMV